MPPSQAQRLVSFRSGGVDHQEIGGAWETIGTGVVRDGVLRARWWCFDLSRNYANNGGCEMRFVDEDKLHVEYYHDADERIEATYTALLERARNEGAELVELERWGAKSVDNLLSEIDAARRIDFDRFLGGDEAGAHVHAVGAQGQRCDETACVRHAAG